MSKFVEHVHCSQCGKRVSGVDPEMGLVVRAWVECPECIESKPELTADLEAARAENARLEQGCNDDTVLIERMTAELVARREVLETAEQERDAARREVGRLRDVVRENILWHRADKDVYEAEFGTGGHGALVARLEDALATTVQPASDPPAADPRDAMTWKYYVSETVDWDSLAAAANRQAAFGYRVVTVVPTKNSFRAYVLYECEIVAATPPDPQGELAPGEGG